MGRFASTASARHSLVSSFSARTLSDRELTGRSARHVGPSFRRAATVMFKVLRNVTAGAALSSLFVLLFSRGNVFVPLGRQSICDFASANAVWYVALHALLTTAYLSATLMDEKFIANSATAKPHKFLLWCGKLAWRLSAHLLVACVATALFVRLVACKIRECRLDIYFAAVCLLYLTVCLDVYARHLVQTETARGGTHRQLQQLAPRGQFEGDSQLGRISCSFALRVARMNAPLVLSSLLAIVYVHGIILVLDISQQWQFGALLGCSMMLKVAIHGAIRAAVLRRQSTPTHRIMMVLIATPTILIETQVRVYQLRLGSNTSKVVTIVVLALLEVAIRAGKLETMKRKLARRKQSFLKVLAVTVQPASQTAGSSQHHHGTDPDKSKMRALHMTETFADMYAEYIAMGCAHVIFVCFSEHPFFAFEAGSASTRFGGRAYWLILLLQVAVEVAVDTAACMVEALMGVQFERLDQDDWPIMLSLVSIAFVNIGMCAGLYLAAP